MDKTSTNNFAKAEQLKHKRLVVSFRLKPATQESDVKFCTPLRNKLFLVEKRLI